jgi:HD-GYP domain-containing protein (c-di-GMP phosphodiesterase class II)
MKKLSLEQLATGMRLAKTVYSPDGRVMVAAGTELNPSIILKLKDKGLPSAYVEDDSLEEKEDEGIVSEKTIAVLYQAMYGMEQELRMRKELLWDRCREPLFALIDEVVSHRGRLFSSTDIRVNEAYLYGHSINVALLAVMIGSTLGYNALKLREVAIGALLHDVGMFLLPADITYKRGPLTPSEQKLVHEHPTQGFQLLRGRPDITAVIANIAYQHHERLDGSGYPRNLNKEKIIEMAQIVAVADVYDAMVSERVYRKASSPNRVINYLRANAGHLFEPIIVAALIKNVSEFNVGAIVQLNDGQSAEVLKINHADGRRPIVGLPDGKVIDLMKERHLLVVEDHSPVKYVNEE